MSTVPKTDIPTKLRELKPLLLHETELMERLHGMAGSMNASRLNQSNELLAALRMNIAIHLDSIESAGYGAVYFFTYTGPHGLRKNVYPTLREANQAKWACGESRGISSMWISPVHVQKLQDFDTSCPSKRTDPKLFDPDLFILSRDAAHCEKMDMELRAACELVAERLRGAPYFLSIEGHDPLSFGWQGVFANRAECNATIEAIKERTKHAIRAQDMLVFKSRPYTKEGCRMMWSELRRQDTEAIVAKILAELGHLPRAPAPEADRDRDRS